MPGYRLPGPSSPQEVGVGDAAPSELVAVKVLEEHPTACALPRFLREAEITCSLGPHPNLVRGLESGAHPYS